MHLLSALTSLALAPLALAAALPNFTNPVLDPRLTDDCHQLTHYFSFGASFTQTMFNENHTQPSLSNPMGNPSPPETFTGGPLNYVGFLTQKYNSTPVYNYNFARGGATTDRALVPTGPDSTTFEEQVHSHFLPTYGSSGNKTWHSNNTFFSFHFGINDITLTLERKDVPVPSRFALVPAVLDKYFGYVEELYKAGGRRFLVVNVPPQDRSPMVRGEGEAEQQEFKEFIAEYNAQLRNRTEEFENRHEGAVAAYFDVHKFESQVLDDPKTFGFPDASCIDTKGQKCVWFNNFHVGERFDDMWSERMKVAVDGLMGWNGSQPVGGYYS